MKKNLEILIKKNNLVYSAKGWAYFDINYNHDVFNDNGVIVAMHEEVITFDEIILNEVTVFDSEQEPIYQGEPLPRHIKFFTEIVENYDIDYDKDYINIEN